MPDTPADAVDAARAHAAAQREIARGLESDLPALNTELGELRVRQERLQRPSTLVTETGRQRLANWIERLRARLGRR